MWRSFWNATVSWKSSIKRCITAVICEAEYDVLCVNAKRAIFKKKAVLVFLVPKLARRFVYISGRDNEGAITIANKLNSASRSERIDTKIYFIPDLVRAGQYAILTKALRRKNFMWSNVLRLRDWVFNICGRVFLCYFINSICLPWNNVVLFSPRDICSKSPLSTLRVLN